MYGYVRLQLNGHIQQQEDNLALAKVRRVVQEIRPLYIQYYYWVYPTQWSLVGCFSRKAEPTEGSLQVKRDRDAACLPTRPIKLWF